MDITATYDFLSKELKKNNIRLSHHRLKVLEYLSQNFNHPTVDKIFVDLQKEVPTLSKTTIYNTLGILVKAGIIRVVTIEDNETRYDIIIENRGHFKCESCGLIYNFAIDLSNFDSLDLAGFDVFERSVYFKGICYRCLSNKKNQNREDFI